MLTMNVVLQDPTREYWEGALVTPEMARQLEVRGVCTIPSVPELSDRNGAGGYLKRSWGAGWPLGQVPGRVCPIALFVQPVLNRLHWRCRIRLAPGVEKPAEDGLLRLVPDAQQICTSVSGFSAGEGAYRRFRDLGEPDQLGGWTVGGTIGVQTASHQYLAMALHAFGPGMLV